jgi:hypothetical protein
MSRNRKNNSASNSTETRAKGKNGSDESLPAPINIADGIPDRAGNPSRKRLIVVLILFAAWCAFLVYCLLAGRTHG